MSAAPRHFLDLFDVPTAQLRSILDASVAIKKQLKSNAKPPPEFRKVTTWVSVVVCAILLFAVAIALRR